MFDRFAPYMSQSQARRVLQPHLPRVLKALLRALECWRDRFPADERGWYQSRARQSVLQDDWIRIVEEEFAGVDGVRAIRSQGAFFVLVAGEPGSVALRFNVADGRTVAPDRIRTHQQQDISCQAWQPDMIEIDRVTTVDLRHRWAADFGDFDEVFLACYFEKKLCWLIELTDQFRELADADIAPVEAPVVAAPEVARVKGKRKSRAATGE